MFRKAFLIGLLLVSTQALADNWDRGAAAYDAGDYATAIAEFRQVVEQNPEGYRGNLMLGLSLKRTGDLSGALPSLRKAYDLKAWDNDIKMELADVYIRLGRYDEGCFLFQTMDPTQLSEAYRNYIQQFRAFFQQQTGNRC